MAEYCKYIPEFLYDWSVYSVEALYTDRGIYSEACVPPRPRTSEVIKYKAWTHVHTYDIFFEICVSEFFHRQFFRDTAEDAPSIMYLVTHFVNQTRIKANNSTMICPGTITKKMKAGAGTTTKKWTCKATITTRGGGVKTVTINAFTLWLQIIPKRGGCGGCHERLR